MHLNHPGREPARRAVPWAPVRKVIKAIAGVGRSVIEWVRAGYPEEAPKTGYYPLMALTGPMSLTRRQIRQVVARLRGRPTDAVTINVAITEVTGRLPNPTQTRAVARAIAEPEPDTA